MSRESGSVRYLESVITMRGRPALWSWSVLERPGGDANRSREERGHGARFQFRHASDSTGKQVTKAGAVFQTRRHLRPNSVTYRTGRLNPLSA